MTHSFLYLTFHTDDDDDDDDDDYNNNRLLGIQWNSASLCI